MVFVRFFKATHNKIRCVQVIIVNTGRRVPLSMVNYSVESNVISLIDPNSPDGETN